MEVEEGLAVGVGLGPGAGPEHGALGVGEQGPSPRSLICACNLKIWTPMCLLNFICENEHFLPLFMYASIAPIQRLDLERMS